MLLWSYYTECIHILRLKCRRFESCLPYGLNRIKIMIANFSRMHLVDLIVFAPCLGSSNKEDILFTLRNITQVTLLLTRKALNIIQLWRVSSDFIFSYRRKHDTILTGNTRSSQRRVIAHFNFEIEVEYKMGVSYIKKTSRDISKMVMLLRATVKIVRWRQLLLDIRPTHKRRT